MLLARQRPRGQGGKNPESGKGGSQSGWSSIELSTLLIHKHAMNSGLDQLVRYISQLMIAENPNGRNYDQQVREYRHELVRFTGIKGDVVIDSPDSEAWRLSQLTDSVWRTTAQVNQALRDGDQSDQLPPCRGFFFIIGEQHQAQSCCRMLETLPYVDMFLHAIGQANRLNVSITAFIEMSSPCYACITRAKALIEPLEGVNLVAFDGVTLVNEMLDLTKMPDVFKQLWQDYSFTGEVYRVALAAKFRLAHVALNGESFLSVWVCTLWCPSSGPLPRIK
jgi:hypothetical protein